MMMLMMISVENRTIFSPPCILHPRWRGSSWNCVPALGVKKLEWCQERSFTISSTVWIQSTNVTDGQTPGDSKDRAYALRRVVKMVFIKTEKARYTPRMWVVWYMDLACEGGTWDEDEMNMVRWMCEIELNERKRNEELGELLGLKPVSLMIKKSSLRWFWTCWT